MNVAPVTADGSSGLGGMLPPVLMEAVVREAMLDICAVSVIVAPLVNQSTGDG